MAIDFPKFIKTLRRENKLSQQKFADKIYVSNKTVQSWEYNYATPSRTNMQTVIDEFGLKEEDYPELFEYVSHPHAKDEAGDSKSCESTKSAAVATCEDVKQPLLKRIFNTPLKIVILSVLAIILAVGVFFGVFLILQWIIDIDESIVIMISAICAVAAIAIMLFFQCMPTEKAFAFILAILIAVGVFIGVYFIIILNSELHSAPAIIISAVSAITIAAIIILVYFLIIARRKK